MFLMNLKLQELLLGLTFVTVKIISLRYSLKEKHS
jgi:hypothetical protein